MRSSSVGTQRVYHWATVPVPLPQIPKPVRCRQLRILLFGPAQRILRAAAAHYCLSRRRRGRVSLTAAASARVPLARIADLKMSPY